MYKVLHIVYLYKIIKLNEISTYLANPLEVKLGSCLVHTLGLNLLNVWITNFLDLYLIAK